MQSGNGPDEIRELRMQNSNKKNIVSAVAQVDFVPVAQVVSFAVVARVFEDQPIPFAINSDGSVKMDVYQDWLNTIGQEALAAFAECSEIVFPDVCGATVQPNKMSVSEKVF